MQTLSSRVTNIAAKEIQEEKQEEEKKENPPNPPEGGQGNSSSSSEAKTIHAIENIFEPFVELTEEILAGYSRSMTIQCLHHRNRNQGKAMTSTLLALSIHIPRPLLILAGIIFAAGMAVTFLKPPKGRE